MNKERKEPKYIEIEIPECCRTGSPSCPHAVKREPKGKKENPV